MHSARAGASLKVFYRRNLTSAQAQQKFWQRSVNNTASRNLGIVGVGGGFCEVYTHEFDMSVDWSAASPTFKTAAGGKITIGGGGTDVTSIVKRVVNVPSSDLPVLGLFCVMPI